MNAFIDFGEAFSGETAMKLRGMVKQLSVAYYQEFHFARMDVRTKIAVTLMFVFIFDSSRTFDRCLIGKCGRECLWTRNTLHAISRRFPPVQN